MVEPKVLGQPGRVKILDPGWLAMILLNVFFLLKRVFDKHSLNLF
jgi:hypothetical protein